MSGDFPWPEIPEEWEPWEILLSARDHLPDRELIQTELMDVHDDWILLHNFAGSVHVKRNPHLYHTIVRLRDDIKIPTQLIESWLPAELVFPEALATFDFEPTDVPPHRYVPPKLLATKAATSVTLGRLGEEEAILLEIPVGSVILLFWHYYYDEHEVPILIQRSLYPEGHEVVHERRFDRENEINGTF